MGKNTGILWGGWIALTLICGAALASIMYVGGDRKMLLIGETTSAHHQIELACESCHTANFWDDPIKTQKAMNKACLSCHQDELKVSNDSHPVKKFRDPRNADRRETLDALFCHTCHAEHVPEITQAGAVMLPDDFCVACHEDVGDNRESHAGLGFETCATAGCHNFHDNTALYEQFLQKHAGKADFLEEAILPFAAKTRAPSLIRTAMASEDPLTALTEYLADGEETTDKIIEEAQEKLSAFLTADNARAPAEYLTEDAIAKWAGSGHAEAGVNCAGCHAAELDDASDMQQIEAAWVEAPGLEVCASCHRNEAKTFLLGKHGMRAHPKLSGERKLPEEGWKAVAAKVFKDEPLPPMTVAEARLPMKTEAAHKEVGSCNTCHQPHDVDIKQAAVEACVTCHDDTHTQNYFSSLHFALWENELDGLSPPGSGVSCADCHMPKIDKRRGRYLTTHNQNDYLRPNEKMIRPVCMSCHSLEFSIDALADPKLIESNFNGRPETHIESVDWATKRVK